MVCCYILCYARLHNICHDMFIWTNIHLFLRILCHGSDVTRFALLNIRLIGDDGIPIGFSFDRCIIHSFVLRSLYPSSTILPLYRTMTRCLGNSTPHSASISWITDINDCNVNPGMMGPMLAFIVSFERSSLCMCVDFSVVPSEMVTAIGLSTGVILLAAALTNRQ